jgi:hypothetical protein
MAGRPSLILALAGWFLLASPVLACSSGGLKAARAGSPGDYRGGSAASFHPFAEASPPGTTSQFMSWNARTKIVLVETDTKFVDQSDVGPAHTARLFKGPAPGQLTSFRSLTAPPLRC